MRRFGVSWRECSRKTCGFFCNLPTHLPADMLKAMRALSFLISLALSSSVARRSSLNRGTAFDVASVKPSQRIVGPDYNNQLTYSPTGITARNVTLKRLVAEAYHLQLNQVFGPSWLDKNEYDIDARSAGAGTREQMALMLRSLVAERFKLTEHSEMREMRVYELVVGKSGSKIHPISDGETATALDFIFTGICASSRTCLPSSYPYRLQTIQPNRLEQVRPRFRCWIRQDFQAFLTSAWTSTLSWALICSRYGRGPWKISWD